jgi:predicted methyltransferase
MIALFLLFSCQSEPSTDQLSVSGSNSSPPPAVVSESPPLPPGNGPVSKEQRRAEPPTGVLTDDQLARMLRNRDVWQQPKRVIEAAQIKPGDVVADVGCGAGYWTYYLAEAVGPKGKVYAIDFDPNATSYLQKRLKENPLENVELITSKSFDSMLTANSVDHVMLVNVHFFLRPDEMKSEHMSQVKEDFPDFYGSINKALRKNGQLILVESSKQENVGRGVDADQISAQLKGVQFVEKSRFDWLEPRQYFMLYSVER